MDEVKFRELLEQNYSWPCVYMFKFICPADNEAIARLQQLFDPEVAELSLRPSSKGNYISFTAKELMISVEAVMQRYEQARGIPGLISL
jgi:putative lipoic acid-binding regulatory protein